MYNGVEHQEGVIRGKESGCGEQKKKKKEKCLTISFKNLKATDSIHFIMVFTSFFCHPSAFFCHCLTHVSSTDSTVTLIYSLIHEGKFDTKSG